ncbi:MAG TPA: ABC transporter substrate-binding protein [Longimicrobiales bacterium]|nr:ABC transporter substrate-binding protein [Longimicrobiales bacterium]
MLALTAACADRDAGQPGADDGPRRGGTVVVVNNADLDALNSLVTADKYTQEVNRFVLFLPLVSYGKTLDYQPALAERWEMEGDTAVVFHLRRDVRWHDGVQTTARDVVFTFERAKDPATAFPNAEYFGEWLSAAATDDFTVRFGLRPHAEPLAGLPFLPIMPAHLLDSIPAARMRQAAFNRAPIGNGPFRFVEYRANDRWIFDANPDFPEALGGRPHIDRLVWRPMPDATAQIAEITAGTADIALTPASDQFSAMSQQPGVTGIVRTGRQYASIGWNHRVEPLDNPVVRRAITMAIDRQQIIATLRAGNGTIAVGPIAPYHWAFDDAMQPLPFAPDSARALLRTAGIEDRNGDGRLDLSDGRTFQFELKMPAGSAINRDMAEMIRSNLAAIGVTVTTRPVDFAALIGDLTGAARNFQAALIGWEADFRLNLRDTYHSSALGTPNQIASYANPRVDSLIDRVALVHDRDEARPLYAELQSILRDEQPWSYLYYYPDLVLTRDRVRNVEMDIRGALLNVGKWWVSGPAPEGTGSDSAARSQSPDSAPAR